MATAPRGKAQLPVNFQEQLAREASEIAKRISAPTGDRIRFNSNRSLFTPDGSEGEMLEVVVIDFVSANLFYDGPFDRDSPQPPSCFAMGNEPSMLVPSKNSPVTQSTSCAACPNNQFGSAPNGKGKACKNTRLIAVIPVTALDDPSVEAPIWIMSVPPTSLKAFDSYVHTLSAKHKTIPLGVVTEITLDQSVTFAAPRFNVVRPLTGDEIGVFMPRREEAAQRLATEPDVSQYTPPKPAARGRR